jgi:pimeloyl-ACP methyl ester carboxylesterase
VRAGKGFSGYLKTIDSGFLMLDSFMVHYLRAGTGGSPLILVHGGGMWLYSFRHNIPALSTYFSVIALDMPGYGYTLPLSARQRYGLEDTSEVLLQFMNRLGIDRASFLGHSWGGGWVLHFAHRHPERVEKLVLVDSSGLDVRDVIEWELLKCPVLGPLLLRLVTPGAVKKRLRRSFYRKELVTEDMVHEVYLPLRFEHNLNLQIQIARHQDWSATGRALPEIRHPALVIWGENDRYLPVELLGEFEKRMENAESHVLNRCGHSAHEEYPAEVNSLITGFLKNKPS